MKILADENCETELIASLRMRGHDVVTIMELAPSIDDEVIYAIAQREGRVLLTSDQDFGLIAEHARMRPPAVALMRLERVSPPRRVQIVLDAIDDLSEIRTDTFIVIEPYQVRSRYYEP